ncbi:MAG: hypothetical protein LBV09_00080 [Deferribacteraceae bacterium]|nr:hypothetical protein [Deferribacteraceae bacterium]
MADFFRKEKIERFEERFRFTPGTGWSLIGDDIFVCKSVFMAQESAKSRGEAFIEGINARSKKIDGIAYGCIGNSLVLQGTIRNITVPNNYPSRFQIAGDTMTIPEATVAAIMEGSANNLQKFISEIFKNHAKASSNSPLISGCIQNNFGTNEAFSGYKLKLVLNSRVPIRNPHTSGTEAEYFLIGSVKRADCTAIQYLGWSKEGKGNSKAVQDISLI